MTATYFDTHCHLNFKRFNKTLSDVVSKASTLGVSLLVVPGTDVISSKKAVALTQEYNNLYAAVGIHPHHVYEVKSEEETVSQLSEIETLLSNSKVVAIGEVGLDRHDYENTKYTDYTISNEFIRRQMELLQKQITLAIRYKKSLILHNRETKQELLTLLKKVWDTRLEKRTVFHCCESDLELLSFAKDHKMYIGVDGDVTFDLTKQSFISQVPLEMLVLETDSPFLLPEPLKSQKLYPNTPHTIPLIAECVAKIKGITLQEVASRTTENARGLFNV